MNDDEILALVALTGNEPTDAEMIAFARAIESRTLTNQKAKWYQEGVEAGLRQALAEPEIKRSQELFGKTERLEAENQRLQEREWIGLTKEEMYNLFEKYSDRPFSLMLATHDKVKEKNT